MPIALPIVLPIELPIVLPIGTRYPVLFNLVALRPCVFPKTKVAAASSQAATMSILIFAAWASDEAQHSDLVFSERRKVGKP